MASKIWEARIEITDSGLSPDMFHPKGTNLTKQEILELLGFDVPDYVRVQVKELIEK